MSGLLVAFVIAFTVIAVFALGVAVAYFTVTGILHAFAYRSRQRAATPILVPSHSQAGGD